MSPEQEIAASLSEAQCFWLSLTLDYMDQCPHRTGFAAMAFTPATRAKLIEKGLWGVDMGGTGITLTPLGRKVAAIVKEME